MEQKMNRVIRACVEMGEKNPIVSMHDQGAGGNCNVVKELIEPAKLGTRNPGVRYQPGGVRGVYVPAPLDHGRTNHLM